MKLTIIAERQSLARTKYGVACTGRNANTLGGSRRTLIRDIPCLARVKR